MWDRIFRGDVGPEPDEIHFEYGSQFTVDRATVVRRPLGFYRNAYDSAIEIAGWSDDANYKVGVFFESTWHMIFGGGCDNG